MSTIARDRRSGRYLAAGLRLLCAGALLGAAPRAALAQASERDPTRAQVSRAELERLLTSYTQAADSRGYTPAFRERARAQAAVVRARLDDGDLQVGDRVELVVEGQPALTQTFPVSEGRVLVLPDIGEIALKGVLRSEVEHYLAAQLARYVRQPAVHARSLLRISVMGAIVRPGFYLLPADALLTDALMAAGGPAPNADIDRLRIERQDAPIWQGPALQQVITEGYTLDQLNLRAGDRLLVPGHSGGRWETIRDVLMITTPILLLLSAFGVTR